MDRAPILVRTDASAAAGWEPFYQSLTYAAMLQRRRRPTYFMGQIEPFPLISQTVRGGSDYLTAGAAIGTAEDCDETIREVRRLGASAVIVNAPGVQEEYLRELAATGATVVVIDSEAEVCFPNRLVINPLMGLTSKNYRCESGTQLLLGRKYAMVRPVFRRQRAVRTHEPMNTEYRAIVALGDDDQGGHSLPRTLELLNMSRIQKVTTMVRSHHHQLGELKALASKHSTRLEVLTEPSELGTRLPRAHFAVTGGCGLSLEFTCVGVPQLVMTQVDRHIANAQKLHDEGAATYLGDLRVVSENNLRDAVNYLLDDELERVGMARCARNLVDGRGCDRIVNGLEFMLQSPIDQPVSYRRAA
ncbi:MAG: polysaccharide biosynthesis protein [Zavarzinella sp.]